MAKRRLMRRVQDLRRGSEHASPERIRFLSLLARLRAYRHVQAPVGSRMLLMLHGPAPPESDWRAIRRDFCVVGADMGDAMEKYRTRQEKRVAAHGCRDDSDK